MIFRICADRPARCIQEDVIKLKHFPCYWPFVRRIHRCSVWGIHRWPVDSPHKGQWLGAKMFAPEQTVEQTIEEPVIWDTIAFIMTSRKCYRQISDIPSAFHQQPAMHPDSSESMSANDTLWPSDVIWRYRTGSTLAQVMACCLTAPSHYLNQCWLSSVKFCGIQLMALSLEDLKILIVISKTRVKITRLKLHPDLPGAKLCSVMQYYAALILCSDIKETMIERVREVDNPLISLLFTGSSAPSKNTRWFALECYTVLAWWL